MATKKNINIGGVFNSITGDKKIIITDNVFDDVYGFQHTINSNVDAKLKDQDTKISNANQSIQQTVTSQDLINKDIKSKIDEQGTQIANGIQSVQQSAAVSQEKAEAAATSAEQAERSALKSANSASDAREYAGEINSTLNDIAGSANIGDATLAKVLLNTGKLVEHNQKITKIENEIGGSGGEKLIPTTINANLAANATQITAGSSYRLHYIPVKKGNTYYLGLIPNAQATIRYGFATALPAVGVAATFLIEFTERFPRYEYKANADGFLFVCHFEQTVETYGGLVTNADENIVDLSSLSIKQGSLYNGSPTSNAKAVYTESYIPVSAGQYVVLHSNKFNGGKYWKIRICAYDDNKTYVKNLQDYLYHEYDRVWQVSGYSYLRLALSLTDADDTDLDCVPGDLTDGLVFIKRGLIEEIHGNRFDEIDESIADTNTRIERLEKEIGGSSGEKITPITINGNIPANGTQIQSGSTYRLHYIPVRKGNTYYLGVIPNSQGKFRYGFSTLTPAPNVSASYLFEIDVKFPRYEYKAEVDGYLFVSHYEQTVETYAGVVSNNDENRIDVGSLSIAQGSLYNGSPTTNTGAIYTESYIPVSAGEYIVLINKVLTNGKYWRVRMEAYDANKTYVKNIQGYSFHNYERIWKVDNYAYVRIALGLSNADGTDSECRPSDLTNGVVFFKRGLVEDVHGNRFDEIDESIADAIKKANSVVSLVNENKNAISALYNSVETIAPAPMQGGGSNWKNLIVALDGNSNYILKIFGSYTDASISGQQEWFQVAINTDSNIVYRRNTGIEMPADMVMFLPKGTTRLKINFRIPTTEAMKVSIEKVPFVYDYIEGGDFYYSDDHSAKVQTFVNLLSNGGEVEPFLFFTDPHNADFGDAFDVSEFNKYMMPIKHVYDALPIDRVICGGDWLNNEDSRAGAIKKLSYINRVTNKLFRHYHPILGNHDTNYQGGPDHNSDKLSRSITTALMFSDYGRNYYSVKGSASRMYFLDTDLDGEDWMTAYKWSQIDWLANSLLREDDVQNIIFMHIYGDTSKVSVFAHIVNLLIDAYNTKSPIVLDGKTYNFSATNGKVYCIIAGHHHKDEILTKEKTYTATDSRYIITSSQPVHFPIPVVLTTTAKQPLAEGGCTFDIMVANFTEGKLHMIRIGKGTDREINI